VPPQVGSASEVRGRIGIPDLPLGPRVVLATWSEVRRHECEAGSMLQSSGEECFLVHPAARPERRL
jgi:hypothetical protein